LYNLPAEIGFAGVIEGPFVFLKNKTKKMLLKIKPNSSVSVEVKFLGYKQTSEKWGLAKENYANGSLKISYEDYYEQELKKIIPKEEKRGSLSSFVIIKEKKELIQNFKRNRIVNRHTLLQAVEEMAF
jgi:hypothetical protein